MTAYRIESYESLININETGYFRKNLCHDNRNLFALFYFTNLEQVSIQREADSQKFICRFEIDTNLYKVCNDTTIPTEIADAYYLNLENFSNGQIIIEPTNIQVLNNNNQWTSLEDFISNPNLDT